MGMLLERDFLNGGDGNLATYCATQSAANVSIRNSSPCHWMIEGMLQCSRTPLRSLSGGGQNPSTQLTRKLKSPTAVREVRFDWEREKGRGELETEDSVDSLDSLDSSKVLRVRYLSTRIPSEPS